MTEGIAPGLPLLLRVQLCDFRHVPPSLFWGSLSTKGTRLGATLEQVFRLNEVTVQPSMLVIPIISLHKGFRR